MVCFIVLKLLWGAAKAHQHTCSGRSLVGSEKKQNHWCCLGWAFMVSEMNLISLSHLRWEILVDIQPHWVLAIAQMTTNLQVCPHKAFVSGANLTSRIRTYPLDIDSPKIHKELQLWQCAIALEKGCVVMKCIEHCTMATPPQNGCVDINYLTTTSTFVAIHAWHSSKLRQPLTGWPCFPRFTRAPACTLESLPHRKLRQNGGPCQGEYCLWKAGYGAQGQHGLSGNKKWSQASAIFDTCFYKQWCNNIFAIFKYI